MYTKKTQQHDRFTTHNMKMQYGGGDNPSYDESSSLLSWWSSYAGARSILNICSHTHLW